MVLFNLPSKSDGRPILCGIDLSKASNFCQKARINAGHNPFSRLLVSHYIRVKCHCQQMSHYGVKYSGRVTNCVDFSLPFPLKNWGGSISE